MARGVMILQYSTALSHLHASNVLHNLHFHDSCLFLMSLDGTEM